jgi:O-antigen biosynthesis protein WbqP
MKRIFDVIAAALLIIVVSPLLLVISIAVRLTSAGPIFHFSSRIGADNKPFKMLKFRTMKVNTPQLATHLLKDPAMYLTPVGGFLRKTSLDEIPQLINVLAGDMSLVGPRPALFNQFDQIELRVKSGCHILKPGITGWAQVNGRDDISIEKKVELDDWYMKNRSLGLDIVILFLTIKNVFLRRNVSH